VTTPDLEARALLIKKLLNKAESKGVTEQERDAFNAKATALMLQWGIEDAQLAVVGHVVVERIVEHEVVSTSPKSYSYEMTVIGCVIAEQFNCRGFLRKKLDGRVNLSLVGFESDVTRVEQMFTSLGAQCSLTMASKYASAVDEHAAFWSGTDKYNWKRSFIQGFAQGLREKLIAVKRVVVADAAPGTDLVLVDRTKQVDQHIASSMRIGVAGRARRYGEDAHDTGRSAGLRADIGQTAAGSSRRAVQS
jgi:hypothetical protein